MPRPSFFWYDTDFLDYIFVKSSYQKKDGRTLGTFLRNTAHIRQTRTALDTYLGIEEDEVKLYKRECKMNDGTDSSDQITTF